MSFLLFFSVICTNKKQNKTKNNKKLTTVKEAIKEGKNILTVNVVTDRIKMINIWKSTVERPGFKLQAKSHAGMQTSQEVVRFK